ncbi:uncharacterized protein LOC124911385 [Impatiens glandulifera]|uniref:uncharacterized protein LOC124911385 n=1 Tax=Impatiens glandulifera TaxID=253017 RepID=UPI001FB1504F|nr:uncharacterized protein LOC124911385 [Impatiens glandulifera]
MAAATASSLVLQTTNNHSSSSKSQFLIENPLLSNDSLARVSVRSRSQCKPYSGWCTSHDYTNIIPVQKSKTFAPCIFRGQLSCDFTEAAVINNHENASGKLLNSHSSIDHHGTSNDQSSLDKVVVAVDVDEVLGNFVSTLNLFIADRYSLNHSVSEYHVYEFAKIWNCTRDEANIRVHEFFKTPYFKRGIQPIPGAQEALQKLSRFCNFSVVTSRQNAIKDDTIEWIEKHYPGLFQDIHFGNHFCLEGQSRTKSEICSSVGAKILIDDNPRYAAECAEAGMGVLLFDYENSYPWCKTESVWEHPLITKVHNWKQVEDELMSWIIH